MSRFLAGAHGIVWAHRSGWDEMPFGSLRHARTGNPTIGMTIKTRHPDVCRNIDRTKRIIYIASMKPDASSSQSRNRLKALRRTLYYKNRRSAT